MLTFIMNKQSAEYIYTHMYICIYISIRLKENQNEFPDLARESFLDSFFKTRNASYTLSVLQFVQTQAH